MINTDGMTIDEVNSITYVLQGIAFKNMVKLFKDKIVYDKEPVKDLYIKKAGLVLKETK